MSVINSIEYCTSDSGHYYDDRRVKITVRWLIVFGALCYLLGMFVTLIATSDAQAGGLDHLTDTLEYVWKQSPGEKIGDNRAVLGLVQSTFRNGSLRYISDGPTLEEDVLQLPKETFEKGGGDCEDLALVVMDMLHYFGVPLNDIGYMLYSYDDQETTTDLKMSVHLVPLLKVDNKWYVLEMEEDGLPAYSYADYVEVVRDSEIIYCIIQFDGLADGSDAWMLFPQDGEYETYSTRELYNKLLINSKEEDDAG